MQLGSSWLLRQLSSEGSVIQTSISVHKPGLPSPAKLRATNTNHGQSNKTDSFATKSRVWLACPSSIITLLYSEKCLGYSSFSQRRKKNLMCN